MQTLSEENYLKAIYHLGKSGNGKVSPTAIADALDNNPASVVDMLKKLTEKKLISYDKAAGVRLLEKGHKLALEIVRRHRLWEVFLLEKLGYGWDEVHDIAEQLEHIHHPELADRLDHFLGSPDVDPHGDPIPRANGELPVVSTLTLFEAGLLVPCQVTGVKDTTPSFLQYLRQLNIGIGTQIEINSRIEWDGSMVVTIADTESATVSRKFAENLVVVTKL